ncbi:TetR/AcrR family transcriptional regulator [Embleya sp. NPDC050493]|uniref:TetR/AcrR family transcriptional regulator n=1 Tax=Embleya sp. NPDC050493 TaxID=3363989 RepID=UPI0037BD8374
MSGRKQFDVGAALDQAMRVFWERGYTDASLDALTSATGLGRGSLYGTFGNKDALFGRCLDLYASIHGTRYEQALAAHPDDPVRAVGAFFDVVLSRIADPSVPAGCLIVQSAAQSPMLSEEIGIRVRGLLDVQRRRVRAALARSSASPGSLNASDASDASDASASSDASAASDSPDSSGSSDSSGSRIDARTLDELAMFVVAVNQSLAVLSRAGASDAELRSVARLACATVANTLAADRPAGPEDG